MLSGFLARIPQEVYLCDKVADCAPYYLRADPCAAPLIFGIRGKVVLGHITPNLIPLQTAVQQSCPEPKPACAPQPVRYDCIRHLCTVLPR